MVDVNVYQENLFHTKMMLKEYDLNNYLFGTGVGELDDGERKAINKKVKREMREIFYGRNLPEME
jgi:S-adenosylmethionine decarboxylase